MKFIHFISPIDKEILNKRIISGYTNGLVDKNTAECLYNMGADIHHKNDTVFCIACNTGNLDMVTWIYSLGDIDVHRNNDQFRTNANIFNQVNIVTWINSLP